MLHFIGYCKRFLKNGISTQRYVSLKYIKKLTSCLHGNDNMDEKGKKIILFDGVCNLCNSSIQFVIKRDKKDIFRYAALQSQVGQKLIDERAIDISKVDSIILVEARGGLLYKIRCCVKYCQKFWGCLGNSQCLYLDTQKL